MAHRRRIVIPAPSAAAFELEPGFRALCERWSLRALVELGGYRSLIHEGHCSDPVLLDFIGVEVGDGDFDRAATLAKLRARHRKAIARRPRAPKRSPLTANLAWLAGELALTPAEERILLFRVLEEHCPQLRSAVNSVGELNASQVHTLLSVLLDLELEQVRAAFADDSGLSRARLANIDESSTYHLHCKLELIDGLADRLSKPQDDPLRIFGASFLAAPAASLDAASFAHLGERIEHLRAYLAHALANRATGVNVLLHGPPGTGKTELSRTLASLLGAQAFEVAVENRRGHQLDGAQRLSAYGLAQQVLARRGGALLVFDELEDIRLPGKGDSGERPGPGKGWFNMALERNPVPTVWLSNDVGFLDPAHLRRFDYHLRLDIPPADIRARMLTRHAAALGVSEAWCSGVSANDALSPAVIARAARVVGAMRAAGVDAAPESLLEEVVCGALDAQSVPFRRNGGGGPAIAYRLDTVNADCELEPLLAGLRESRQGRICLYGAPGTGKSAFAAHVAAALGLPAVLKRASDLLNPFVGGTERLMAAAFEEARRERGVLILDEADSFLRSRERARNGWEITAVNEMLTQIEAFDGIFFATTNLMSQLDEASLRRFDLKVCFDYLRPEQARRLLAETAQALGIDGAEAVRAMPDGRLAPGDFANVIRQARLRPVRDVEDLIARLGREAGHRAKHTRRPIGFLDAA